jgi:hypothetical protein
VSYPSSALAAAKARGDGVIDDEIGLRAKPADTPAPVGSPPAPRVAHEKPPAPAQQAPPAVLANPANPLEQLVDMARQRNNQLEDLLRMPGLPNPALERLPFDQLPNGPAQLDQELEQLFKMARMQDLDLVRAARTMQGLSKVPALAGLGPLGIRNTIPPAPAAVPPQDVSELTFSGNGVNDRSLEPLRGLPGLRVLNLAGTAVTGAGLEHLKGLVRLNLRSSAVTDEGLEHLHRLTQLRELDLTGTRVSDAAVRRLQEALPAMKITR